MRSWYQIVVLVLALSILTACAAYTGSKSGVQIEESEQLPQEPLCCEELVELHHEIEQLKKQLAEKELLIHKQNQIQQKQIQVQQEASNEVSRAQLKLHRLATKPSTASTIAEVEVAMGRLRQEELTDADQQLQVQAQVFLDSAAKFYQQEEYTSSMNYASQAYEIINMVLDQERVKVNINRTLVGFHVPVTLQTKSDANIRQEPIASAPILRTLEKNAKLIANAYQGNWLRVQIEGDEQGWVHNSLVKARLNGVF